MIEHNGKQYARVSEVLEPYSDFSHISNIVLEKKQILGTNVHDAISDYLQGDIPCITKKEYGYFRSFKKWFDTTQATFLETEQRYFDDERMITGRIDGLIKFKYESLPILLDYKTTLVQNETTWIMQGHFYFLILKFNLKVIADRFLFLRLKSNGSLPVVYTYKYDKNIEAKCNEAIKNFWSKKNLD